MDNLLMVHGPRWCMHREDGVPCTFGMEWEEVRRAYHHLPMRYRVDKPARWTRSGWFNVSRTATLPFALERLEEAKERGHDVLRVFDLAEGREAHRWNSEASTLRSDDDGR